LLVSTSSDFCSSSFYDTDKLSAFYCGARNLTAPNEALAIGFSSSSSFKPPATASFASYFAFIFAFNSSAARAAS